MHKVRSPRHRVPGTDASPHVEHLHAYVSIASATIFTLALLAVLATPTTNLETTIFRWFNDLPDALRPLFLLITETATEFMLVFAVAVALFARKFKTATTMLFAGGGGYAAVLLLKHLVERPRAFNLISDVNQRIAETGFGFPSGHTTLATALGISIALVLGGYWRWVAGVWIVLVAASRMYLGVHMPLDIIGAIGLGTLAALTVYHLMRWLWEPACAFVLAIVKKSR